MEVTVKLPPMDTKDDDEVIYLNSRDLVEINSGLLKKSVKMKKFVAYCNSLKSLPKLYQYYPNLVEIDLWKNQFVQLPHHFGEISNLTVVKLTDNQLTDLPESFGSLVNLNLCYLGGNKLKNLPQSFSKLVNLEELYLNINRLEEFPLALQNITNLVKLDLCSNMIGEIPTFVGNFKSLKDFKLCSLKLKGLPEEIGNLGKLKLLDLSLNQITSLPHTVSKLTSLNTLRITWNDFEELPTILPSQLANFHVGGNKFVVDIDTIGSINVHFKTILPDQITKKLWLGPLVAGHNKHYLKAQGITHILSVLDDYNPTFPEDFTYHIISIEDEPTSNIKQYFKEAIEFMDSAIDSKGKVFVHCAAGISRSSTILIAYLMKSKQISFKQAFKLVKTKRPVISPNLSFISQLEEFEKELVELSLNNPKCILS